MKRTKTFYSLFILLSLSFVLYTSGQAQILHPTNGTVTLEACEDFFDGELYYDSGGPNAPYSSNESGTLELCADCGQTVTVEFLEFDVETSVDETCWDHIVVIGSINGQDGTYGGDDSDFGSNMTVNDPNCLDLTDDDGDTQSGGGSNMSSNGVVSSSTFETMEGGCLSITFNSDDGVNQTGWEAMIHVSTCETVIPEGGPVACNNQIQVSLDQFCEAEITPDMILEGTYPCFENFTVEIEGIEGVVVTEPGSYVVTITDMISGNNCWGNILVEDNIPPFATDCPCDEEVMAFFEDDFDSYANGENLDMMNGWQGWDGTPAFAASATNAEAYSAPNSVEISGTDDMVRQFSGLNSGTWIVSARQYIPSNFTGLNYIIILNTYSDGGPYNWSCQLQANAATGEISNFLGVSGGSLPIVYDQWVEIRVEIDLDADNQIVYYDGEMLFSGTYTDQVTGNGATTIAALDLFSDGSSAVYYDDISIIDASMQPCELSCVEAAHLYENDDVTEELGWNPSFDDNCGNYSVDFDDQYIDGGVCGVSSIIRTWTATYTAHGEEESIVLCVQTFHITPATIDEVNFPPQTVILPCGTDTSPAGVSSYVDNYGYYEGEFDIDPTFNFQGLPTGFDPYDCFVDNTNPVYSPNNDGYAIGYPYVLGDCGDFIPLNPTVCNLNASYTDQVIDDCGNSVKVIRLWQILDWCNPQQGTTPYSQIIKAIDEEPPHIDVIVNSGSGACEMNVMQMLSLGNGDDGEGIAFNPTDGKMYHVSGIDEENEYFEAIDLQSLTVGPNLVPDDTYPEPFDEDEITAIAWYPPLGAFVAMNRDEYIFSITATGEFTLLSEYDGGEYDDYVRGFAVVGSNVYGISPFSEELVQIDIFSGNTIKSIVPMYNQNPVAGNGLAVHPCTGEVYIIFKLNFDDEPNQRRIGTIDVNTGTVSDIGLLPSGFAGISFDSQGTLWGVTGDGGNVPETLYKILECEGCNEIIVSADPWSCEKELTLPVPEHLFDDCDDYVTYWVEIAGITNDPFNLPFSETMTLGNPHYFPGDMIDGDATSGYTIVGLPKGSHIVNYFAEDACGNISIDQISVKVVDETPPVAVAKQNIVISLTSGSTDDNGIAKLYVNSIDNGSHDGCSEELYYEIRREDQNSCWNNTFSYRFPFSFPYSFSLDADPDGGQYVKFCCDDLMADGDGDGEVDGLVKVVLRVWDDGDCDGVPGEWGEDNYNDTWAYVRVEDKLPPTIQCPPDVTIDCDEDYLDMTLTGSAVAYTTCGAVTPNFSDNVNLDGCGIGTVTRTWSIITSGGSASCTQIIYVQPTVPFGPNDITPPTSYYEFECSEGNTNEPSWNTVPCSLVGMSVDEQEFIFEDGACRKIIRTWTIIDWCQYDPPEGGVWEYDQIIKIYDDTAPTLDECDPGTLWATEDCLAQDVVFTNRADDAGECPSDWLKWEVCVDINYDWSCDHIWTSNLGEASADPNDNIYYVPPSAQGDDVDVPVPSYVWANNPGQPDELDLPLGDHRVVWTVHDGCGNVTTCTQIWTVEDKKAPTPYCVQVLSTATMDHGGFVDIWAIDFDLASEDNCPGDLRFTFTDTPPESDPNYDPALRSSYQRFNCLSLGEDKTETFDLEMYVWDVEGNYDYCFVQLRVDDNQDVCDYEGEPRASISGLLTTDAGEYVDQVDVSLYSNLPEFPISQMSDGEYAFMNNLMYHNYEISAEKDDNYLNGVSTLDMVLMQQHILGLALLNNPYKVIAADVNSDEKVSALDLVQLRKLILGIIEELPNNDSWRFVDAVQDFDDVNNPWPFTEILTVDNLVFDMMAEDFIATKIGDVSGDAEANIHSQSSEIRTNASLDLQVDDRSYAAGEEVRVDVKADNFTDMYGYQFTMNYSGLAYSGVEAGALNVTTDNFGLHRTNEGMISTSWASSEAVSSTGVLFSIYFIATTDGVLSESISVGSAITPAEAYRGSSLSVEHVSIEFRTDNGSVSSSEYKLYQNEPNPFASATVIGFELPTASEATITVYDVTGKVVKVVRGDYAKGYNEVSLERNELNSAGVMYYQLASDEYTATKKMILID